MRYRSATPQPNSNLPVETSDIFALSKLGTDFTLLKWMAGFNIALSVAMLGILLRSLA